MVWMHTACTIEVDVAARRHQTLLGDAVGQPKDVSTPSAAARIG
jgi:hypothetical protein